MQKHQWRQHGVVYCKSRPQPPPPPPPSSATVVQPTSTTDVCINAPPESPPPPPKSDNVIVEKVVYGDQMNSVPVIQQNTFVRPMSEVVVTPIASNSHWLPSPVNREDKLRLTSPLLYNRLMGISMKDQRPPPLSEPQLHISGPALTSNASTELGNSQSQQEFEAPAPLHSSPKPIKLKMKFAYQKEMEDSSRREEMEAVASNDIYEDDCEGIPENLGDMKLRSSSASPSDLDPLDSQAQSTLDPLQCLGCNVIFPHKQDLKIHQLCTEDAERPFQCCKCGYKFRQKAHLQKHQWRIHRKRFCDPEPVSTITMQDIINHGVEKSLQEMPVYHGKTTSKYYSEVLGLEYAGVDVESQGHNDNAQPLDLSPVKKSEHMAKMRQLENSPLLNQPPLPYATQRSFGAGLSSSLPTSMSPLLPASSSFALAKKQRTESATHSNLPKIGLLQKPTMVSLTNQKVEGSVFNNYKHSSWIHTPHHQTPTDLTVEKKFNQPEYLCNKLNLQGPNGRTV